MARILIPLAQGCEELEAVTVIDLLRRAGLDVVTAGLVSGPIKASRGVMLLPDVLLDDVLDQPFQMIVLPGGLPGADHLDRDPRIRTLLERITRENGYIAAICAAPKVLARAGLLAGRRATGYPGVLDPLNLQDVTIDTAAVVQDGQVITSRGPGTAMDFALALISILAGKDKRAEVEAGLVR
jgi:4-methyl-5(b-hydroxyethyl)-thiazole monophosphate biosynthesis